MSWKATDLEVTVWEDELAKHMRFATPEFGVSISVELTPVDDDRLDGQVESLMVVAGSLLSLVDAALEHVAEDHG